MRGGGSFPLVEPWWKIRKIKGMCQFLERFLEICVFFSPLIDVKSAKTCEIYEKEQYHAISSIKWEGWEPLEFSILHLALDFTFTCGIVAILILTHRNTLIMKCSREHNTRNSLSDGNNFRLLKRGTFHVKTMSETANLSKTQRPNEKNRQMVFNGWN